MVKQWNKRRHLEGPSFPVPSFGAGWDVSGMKQCFLWWGMCCNAWLPESGHGADVGMALPCRIYSVSPSGRILPLNQCKPTQVPIFHTQNSSSQDGESHFPLCAFTLNVHHRTFPNCTPGDQNRDYFKSSGGKASRKMHVQQWIFQYSGGECVYNCQGTIG